MTRPFKIRHIGHQPRITYYKPQGVPLRYLDEIVLTLDEVEAIRLRDAEGIEQTQAAKKMKISQSTFQRILSSAHQKIAQAVTTGKAIRFEGGNIKIEKEIASLRGAKRKFKCEDCLYQWSEPFGTGKRGIDMVCPKCKSGNIHRIDYRGYGFGRMLWGRRRR
jgi:predicted DNA-binding protein (UPF0251 family)